MKCVYVMLLLSVITGLGVESDVSAGDLPTDFLDSRASIELNQVLYI